MFCSGSTALLYAVKQGNDSIVRLLLEHGADVHAEILDEETLRQRAEYETVQLAAERMKRLLRGLQTADGDGADAETIGDLIADAETFGDLFDGSNCINM